MIFISKTSNCRINPPSIPDVRFCKYLPRQPPLTPNTEKTNNDGGLGDWWQTDEDDNVALAGLMGKDINELDNGQPSLTENFALEATGGIHSDEDIKEMVESVKNAVLSYRNVEQEDNVIGENFKSNRGNANVITNLKELKCDNLDSSVTELDESLTNLSLTNDETVSCSVVTHQFTNNPNASSSCDIPEVQNENIKLNQVNLHCGNATEDDSLHLYNSYNYWYISPAMPVDLSIFDEGLDRGQMEAYKCRVSN